MSDDIVNIEVNGKPVEARKGQMIIEVTDAMGAYVPRFCYHEKLTRWGHTFRVFATTKS